MLGSLSTVGYTTRYAGSDLQNVLIANKQALLVDTRLTPWCSWSALWQRPGLEQRYGNRYIWKGDVLGNVHYHQPDKPIQIANAAIGYPWIIERLEEGFTCILLCGCAFYERCHRKVIYDAIKAQLGDRLPVFTLGQRVMTPNGPGVIDPDVPLEVQRQRNRYAVMLDVWHPLRYYAPDQLTPYRDEQLGLLATALNPYNEGMNVFQRHRVNHWRALPRETFQQAELCFSSEERIATHE
jgi:hypothetical protein